MNKKKLPKVIRRTTDQPDAPAAADASERPAAAAARPADKIVETAPKPDTARSRAADASVAEAPTPADRAAARRRAQARRIVERHATYSAVGGIIPVPIANMAGVTAIIVRMIKRLSGHYRVPFERARARAIVVGLVGGTMPTGLATVTSTTLAALLPTNLISLAVSCATAAAFTRGIGLVFVDHFESGATLADFPTPIRKSGSVNAAIGRPRPGHELRTPAPAN